MSDFNNKITRGILLLLFGATTYLVATCSATAQTLGTVTWDNNGGVGNFNWATASNWDTGFVPEAASDELAQISNGDTVLVTGSVPMPAEVLIGGGSTVRVTGNLSTTDADTVAIIEEGDIQIGGDSIGRGTLIVESGGSLNAFRRLQEFGPGESLLELLGTASVSVTDEATLDRRTRITGPSVTFTAGSLSMGNVTSFEPVITGANHSVINVTGNATLAGALRADLSAAGQLSVGQTWDLITAGTVGGSFNSVAETSGVLLPGQRLFTQNVTSGTTTVQLGILQELFLEVNSDTGAVAIKSSDNTPVDLDGYAIGSGGEHLNPNTWGSLFDQSEPQWVEATMTRERLSEVQLSGTTGVTNSSELQLGTAFDPQPSAIGEAIDDLTFTYSSPAGSVTGEVVYTGVSIANDMTLVVDSTGAAQIKNASGFAVDIEGYQISTTEGSFDELGWDSLNEQSIMGWVEANPTTKLLTEVDIDNGTHFFEGRAFNIGDLFSGTVPTDLEFRYALEGSSSFTTGKVLYQNLPVLPPIPGDFDNDGDVDSDDLSTGSQSWESRYGVDLDGSDFLAWQRNFGLTSNNVAASLINVPEPGSLCLIVSALIGLGLCSRPTVRNENSNIILNI